MAEPDDSAETSLDEERALHGGLGGDSGLSVRKALELAPEAQDAAVAEAVVRRIAERSMAEVEVRLDRIYDPRRRRKTSPRGGAQAEAGPKGPGGADSSFLGQLRVSDDSGKFDVATLDNSQTVICVARAGTLRQRRAAVLRLSSMLQDKTLKGDEAKRAQEFLTSVRDVEIAYELSEVRANFSGAVGRENREERAQFEKTAQEIEAEVVRYWDGERAEEPVGALPADQRAQLMVRVRDLPDLLAAHLAALIEADDTLDRDRRLELLTSLRFTGDRRLVAALRAVLRGSDPLSSAEAARALGRIDDPRVRPALLRAYERSLHDRHRTVVAGALGMAGDPRGREYVRSTLESDDPEVVRNALDALGHIGKPEDYERIGDLLEHEHPQVKTHAIRTLGRMGDARALSALKELGDETSVSAMWAEMEEAVSAIRARLELRGEEPDAVVVLERGEEGRANLAPVSTRLRSWKDYCFGQLWLLVGARTRAIARFERAATGRPHWVAPLLAIALVHAHQNVHAQALAAFRRAIAVDRDKVEDAAYVMHALTKSFLRRAEEVQREGRTDIARGLLEEVLALDLRRAPSALRFEVARRHDAVTRRRSLA
ncbi:MAG: HEAT repeat domain-containing protein [Myxococcota bacterium]